VALNVAYPTGIYNSNNHMLFTIRLGSLSIWWASFSTISFEANHTHKIQMIWKNQTKKK